MERFQESCGQFILYRRSHRSAQKHIDEIAWIFQDVAAERGSLPPDEFSAERFDGDMNDCPRNSKGHKDYYYPDEEMMAHWLRQYCSLEESTVQTALDRRMEVKREVWALQRQLDAD